MRIIVLSGPPCSGKTTFAMSLGLPIVSKDIIRKEYFPQPYRHSSENDRKVKEIEDELIDGFVNKLCIDCIIDNTHCKDSYLENIYRKYANKHKIEIKFFKTSLARLLIRNYIRWFQTSKWIPIKDIVQLYKNYKKINQKKYEYLLYE